MDLCLPSRIEEPGGEKYFMLIIRDYLRLTLVEFLRNKSNAFNKFKISKALTENQIGCKIKCIMSERAGEFTSYEFSYLCNEIGIKWQFTIVDTPQQNGVVERQNISVQQMAIALIQEIRFLKPIGKRWRIQQ